MSDGDERQFLDTNVLAHAHDATAGPKRIRAHALLMALWHSGAGCLSMQVLQEFYATATRKLSAPLSPAAAREVVALLANWTVHRPDVEDLLRASLLQERHRLSFWDALILQSAIALGCETLWSEDLKPGQTIEGVTVRNPFA